MKILRVEELTFGAEDVAAGTKYFEDWGLEKTAGLITSAAAIMVAVFSAFSIASVVLIQAVGVGMALAVAIDATLVRVLMVPATMRLFGNLNWWAPRWLLGLRAKIIGE